MSAGNWQPIDTAPEGVVVDTKIDNSRFGMHNLQPLKRTGTRWFRPAGDRVYYTPTHWRQQVQE